MDFLCDLLIFIKFQILDFIYGKIDTFATVTEYTVQVSRHLQSNDRKKNQHKTCDFSKFLYVFIALTRWKTNAHRPTELN